MTVSYDHDKTDEGYDAGWKGMAIGTNPYDPTVQEQEYESWLNGWAMGNTDRVAVTNAGC